MPNKQLWIKSKDKLKVLVNSIKAFIVFLIKHNPINKQRLTALALYIRRSWKSIAVILPAFLLSYYIIGGYVTNTIDKNTTVEISSKENELNVIN